MVINVILEQPCVCVYLYSAHVNNVFAPSQRVLGLWMHLWALMKGCVCKPAVEPVGFCVCVG